MKTEMRPTDSDGDVDLDGRATPPTRSAGRDRRIPLPSRSLMLKIHRWLSLGGLVWILIISLTGAVLVFGPADHRPVPTRAVRGDAGRQGPAGDG